MNGIRISGFYFGISIEGLTDHCNGTSGPTYTYDAAGNMTNDCSHNYAYDAEGRVKTVDTTAAIYTYDADGNRATKDVTGSDSTEYIYFGGTGGPPSPIMKHY